MANSIDYEKIVKQVTADYNGSDERAKAIINCFSVEDIMDFIKSDEPLYRILTVDEHVENIKNIITMFERKKNIPASMLFSKYKLAAIRIPRANEAGIEPEKSVVDVFAELLVKTIIAAKDAAKMSAFDKETWINNAKNFRILENNTLLTYKILCMIKKCLLIERGILKVQDHF